LGISPEETSFARRGFCVADPRVQSHLERAAGTFVEGYHLALVETDVDALAGRLSEVEPFWRGFAFEGAAMGLALTDSLVPFRRSRFRAFLAGPGVAHAYMVHVGFGWAAARLPWVRRNLQPRLQKLDPLLRWLVVDGYGFHEGFFHAPRCFREQAVPRRISGYARRAFDQGLGRCLWFAECADPGRIAKTIQAFPPPRREDLWSGIGLACTYAGGVDRVVVEELASVESQYGPQLAQGAAFAAKARERANNMATHTGIACEILCGTSAQTAAAITDECLVDLPPDDAEPAYEHWRQRIQTRLASGRSGIGSTSTSAGRSG